MQAVGEQDPGPMRWSEEQQDQLTLGPPQYLESSQEWEDISWCQWEDFKMLAFVSKRLQVTLSSNNERF